MNTPKTTSDNQSADKKTEEKSAAQVKGDFLLSEKDEVKNAERKLQQGQEKQAGNK